MKKTLHFLLLLPLFVSAQTFWTEVAPFGGGNNYLTRQISIVSPSVIWVWGTASIFAPDFQQFSISTDGGVNWTNGSMDLNGENIVTSLHATSATTAYRTTYSLDPNSSGGVWKTTDAGQNWTMLSVAGMTTDVFPNFVHFFDTNNGIVVSDPSNGAGFQIYRTTDAGANWTIVPSGNLPAAFENEYGYSLDYRTKTHAIWFGTNNGRIFKSADMGASWAVIQSPVTDFGGADISASYDFRTLNEGLLVARDFQFYRTLDGGVSWNTEIPTSSYRNFETIFVNNTNNTYFSIGEDAATQQRGASYSTDGGQSWIDLTEVDDDPVTPVTAKFASGTVGFAIGSYASDPLTQRFFRLTDPLNRMLKNEQFEVPQFTAVPNPTRDLVKITATQNIRSITLSDLSGKTISSENYHSLRADVNLSELPTGMYFAKVISDQSTQVLKLLKI